MTIQLSNYEKIEPETYPWGWIRWLMNDKIASGTNQTVGIVQIDPGQRNPMHGHPNCEELLYVLSGECHHVLGDEAVTMKAGDMIRIPAGQEHYAECTSSEPLQAMIIFSTGQRETKMGS